MLCLRGFELYCRWVSLTNYPRLLFSKEPGKFKFWGSCQYQAGETTYKREFAKLWRSFNVKILKNYNCTPT